MDLVTQTSLEALLQKAINPQNQNIDVTALEAFYTLINKEKDGAHYGVKVIANRLPGGSEQEVLQTLNILDNCMLRCGVPFQNEVGKFRFLNEMIKLVSPKYLGSQTPASVKQKVLQLLYLWTLDYPKEAKIKEAFEMLRKQGVVREIPNPEIELYVPKRKPNNSVFYDEEKSKILQKLLQSKDPEDVQAANWLIKSMVKEDDKRAEINSRRIFELESVQNNVRLLNEMLDSFKPGSSSSDELELIKELRQSCERLKPLIAKLTYETQNNEDMLGIVYQTEDELISVFEKYDTIISKSLSPNKNKTQDTLLDLEQLNTSFLSSNTEPKDTNSIDVLSDIFSNASIADVSEILQPTTLATSCDKPTDNAGKKSNALEELNILGEQLLKENLGGNENFFKKSQNKIPMNALAEVQNSQKEQNKEKCIFKDLDLSCLVNKTRNGSVESEISHDDDYLVDITINDDKIIEPLKQTDDHKGKKVDLKLNDITVQLEDVSPSNRPPRTLFEEENGLSVVLHFTEYQPKPHVHVYVITTTNKNRQALKDFLFQPAVPKGCKLKLQTPSKTDLPPFNPFLPPPVATQIMLIGNPTDANVSLKFIISYKIDEETITEMGEVNELEKRD